MYSVMYNLYKMAEHSFKILPVYVNYTTLKPIKSVSLHLNYRN